MVIGSNQNRLDGMDKVTGALKFPSDLAMDGMLYAVPVLAQKAHAKIVRVNTGRALALPGCRLVLTAKDVPHNRYGFFNDRPTICDDKVRYYGDVVAVAVAECPQVAQKAARLVFVEYEELPLIDTLEKALAFETYGKVHEHMENNICHAIQYQQGDVEAGFQNSAFIVQGEYGFPAADHCFLETECGISWYEKGKLHFQAGSQNVFYDRGQIAKVLGLAEEELVVRAPYCGGAFGGKGDISIQPFIGLVTMKTGRPCKMHLSREERFLFGVKRHAGKIRMKTGVDADGHILAHSVYGLLDGGAYTVFGNVVLEITTECCTGPYRMPNLSVETKNLFTNNGVAGAFRGFGAAQGCFALERQMDKAAKATGLNPVEFRLRNCLKQGEKTGMGHILLAKTGMEEVLKACENHPLLDSPAGGEKARSPWRYGVGFACGMKGYGIGVNDAPDYGYAKVKMGRDGKARVTVGSNEMGQGMFTAMQMMAAQSLSMDVTDVLLENPSDTDCCEETGSTASSRVTYAVGRALCRVCSLLLDDLQKEAAERLGTEEKNLQRCQSGFTVKGRCILFSELVTTMKQEPCRSERVRTAYSEQNAEGGLGHPHVLYSGNAQVAQVRVNVETGMVEAQKFAVVADVGKAIHPIGVEGQSEGGVAMGISYALLEDMSWKEGRPLSTSFSNYLIPTAMDLPNRIENTILEEPEATGPFGAKGMAENATVPTAPAVVNAVCDALNCEIDAIPLSPEFIKTVIEKGTLAKQMEHKEEISNEQPESSR